MQYVLLTDDGHCEEDLPDLAEAEGLAEQYSAGKVVDDITGKELGAEATIRGRLEELKGFREKPVYEYMRRDEAQRRGIKVLGTRWVDKRKGDALRSRLVAQDFAFKKKGDQGNEVDYFAPTPPLVASRYVVSRTASDGMGSRTSRRLLCLDKKGHF